MTPQPIRSLEQLGSILQRAAVPLRPAALAKISPPETVYAAVGTLRRELEACARFAGQIKTLPEPARMQALAVLEARLDCLHATTNVAVKSMLKEGR